MAVRRCPTHSYGTRTAVQTAHCRCRRPLTYARNADSATNRPAMLILALRRPTDHQDERYWSSYAGSLQTVSSQCSSRACRESMLTTAVLVCADSGDVAVLARTAWSVLFCRKHTRPRTLDWSTCCRWWCIEVVARPPGHAGRKREPAVRVLETKAAFAVAEPSSKNLLNTNNTRSCTRRSGFFSRRSSPLT